MKGGLAAVLYALRAHWLEIMGAVRRDLGVEVRAIQTGGGSDGNHTSAVAPTIDGLAAGRTAPTSSSR
jgi:hypothetical protein